MKSAIVLSTCILSLALIGGAALVESGLKRLANGLEASGHVGVAAATQPAEGRQTLLAADEPLRPGDVVEASVSDLIAQGAVSTRLCRIGVNGKIRLWYVGDVTAAGAGSDQLEKTIADAYRDQQLLPRAVVAVTSRRPS